MKVLVTGGTGFTGKAFVKRLIDEGHEVVALDYKEGLKTAEIRSWGAEVIIGSVTEKDIVERTMDKLGERIGVIVEDSIWLHGDYDWIMSFMAEDLKTAKRFYEAFTQQYGENISELKLMETIVTVKKGGFDNPRVAESKKLLD